MGTKKIIISWIVGLIVGLYTALVFKFLWNWFVVPILNTSYVSYWQMYGLVVFLNLIVERIQSNDAQSRWKILFLMIDFCIPESKQEQVREVLEEQKNEIWVDAGIQAVAIVVSQSFALLVGWGIYTFLI